MGCQRKSFHIFQHIFSESFAPRLAITLIGCCCFANAQAQTTIVKDSINNNMSTVVISGKKYDRSNLHNFFWGKHYRKEWATPVRVNNFYLDTAKGGLVTDKPSGSRQSMGLRLKRNDGREYVLRSIDKDFGNGLPDIFHGTFISNIAKDQASLGYPFAALSITPMAAAAGIYHTNPVIVFVPKQKQLGNYSKKYGDQLYLFEERPDDDQHDVPSFGNSKKVIGSEKLYEKIFEDNDNVVDQKSFAKARLFDMFIGDWGRHADQWRWASFKKDEKTIYKPIPRDRDQTYSIFDGFFPFIATNIIGARQLESFHGNIQSLRFFNKPGRELDRQFTNQLTEQDWVNLAMAMQKALTDEVITNAMHTIPTQLYAINGDKITRQLQSRRDHLQDFAHRYYKFLAKKIEIYGTSDKEFFQINRLNNNETNIKIFKIKKDASVANDPIYDRTIFKNETKDIQLFGFKDADVFKINGNSNKVGKIRIIGVTKTDSIAYSGKGKDKNIKVYKGKSDLYDSVFQKKIVFSPIILINPRILKVFDDDPMQWFIRRGIHAGAAINFHPAPWKKDSLETIHTFALNYGISRKIFTAEYVGFAPEAFGMWNFIARARYDGPAADNFFGVGNETIENADLYSISSKYYNVYSKRLFASAGVNRIIKDHSLNVALFFNAAKVNNNTNTYIKDQQATLPVFETRKYTGAEAGYNYNNVNSNLIPTKGFKFNAGAAYVVDVDNTKSSFFKSVYSASVFLPLGKVISIASSAGGSYVSDGNANYYYLSKLSGSTNLRGFPRERFYGKTSFYNNNEIRIIGNTHNFLFNGKIGLLGFYDNGRIWQPAENSNTWHVGYGGGIILAPFNKIVVTASYEMSKDNKLFQLRTGMYF